jgi:parallel beta-helix repeat protein/putative cofactor-binding repeat protein
VSEQRRNFLTKITTTAGAAVAGYFSANPATASNAVNARGPNGEASVLDFMSAEARADARSGAPSLDHSAAIQAAFSSGAAVVNVPGGYVFKLTKPLKIEKTIRVMGGGELRFTAGIANAAAITVTAPGCEFDGVYLTNPNMLQSNSGARNVGIMFRASLGSVTRSTIRYFQNGIQVESTGEYHDFIIANNRVIDCIGAGGGPTQKSTYGEDRGDGITVWGCAATITGNLVTAKAGQDCRIGIHMEGLANYHADSFPLQDNMCTVVGNVVRGPFRRSIVTENVNNSTITGNTCEGAKWWGIAIVRSLACSVTGNTVIFDRAATDGTGSAWDPIHAGIAVYGGAVQCVISGNTIDLTRGHARAAICLLGSDVDDAVAVEQRAATNGTARVTLASANPAVQLGQLITGPGVPSATFVVSVAGTALLASNPIGAGSPLLTFKWHERGQGTAVTNNSVLCNAADGAMGIFAQYQDSPSILGNNLRYMGAHGIHCMDVSDPVINGNTVLGQQSAKHGIYLEASATGAVVVGNVVEGFNGPGGSGIAAANRIGGVVSANLVRRCETGMNLSGCTDMSVTGNSAMSCGTGYSQARGSGMLLASNASAG